ncbi:glycosyltransferase family 4 protein [Ornithinimicrobium sp. Y1847]|uniref:glycosyltransferase family 4 protein n=1 Tax=Ornithinimicrobium sp. Y1847 TaxID=3405419 RepID=UPI003B66C5C6
MPVSDMGGVARHVLDVARHGLFGWRLVVLCPPGPLAEQLRALGTAVLDPAFGPGAGTATSVRALRHTVQRLRPDVVHSHLAYADIVTAIGAPPGARLISTEHGISGDPGVYHSGQIKQRAMATAHSARLRRLSDLIAVSRSTADVVRARWSPPSSLPIHVIHNGVDAIVDPPPATPGLRIGSISRLAAEKNLDVLMDSFDILRRQEPEATLTIAGAGPEEAALRRQVGDLGLQESVNFVGHIDPRAFFQDVDVVAQLSAWENHSYSLLDAVVHGRGVVATAVGGNPEILPARCLVPLDPRAVADAVLTQGRDVRARPESAEAWPDIATMCSALLDVYGADR